jgi:hypothetical protein
MIERFIVFAMLPLRSLAGAALAATLCEHANSGRERSEHDEWA